MIREGVALRVSMCTFVNIETTFFGERELLLLLLQTLNLFWNVNKLFKVKYIDVGSRIDPRKT